MSFRYLRTTSEPLRARRLCFEALERRDLLTVMRVVNWNTLNGPNDAADDANFTTVLQAIGNETVQGNTQRIDILALQETDPPGSGDSIGRVQSVLNTLYPSANYLDVVTSIDGGGDSTGFVFDTTTVSLLASTQVAPGSLTHNAIRGKFRPVGTLGESDFYVYSVHLKSGDTGPDATLRGSEAALIRADADGLNDGANVLIVGDFNMKTSDETAYSNLIASGFGQVQDVADAPGDWFNNPAFRSLHSQDPQNSMDDRFDIQFASGEFFDGVGVDYVSNSFHVFGNNGTHTFDGAITTGTGASPAVLNALFAASDHLPVVADYEIIVSTPRVRVTETLGGTKVVEGGLYDTYQVVLDTVPTANVSVTVTPNSQVDVGNGAGVAKVLTFTPASGLTPQTVAVRASNDAVGEGDHSGLIAHSSASADAVYNAISIVGVNVSIVDNDAPKIVINEIDSDQAGTDTMEFVELYDGGVGNVSLSGKTVVFFNGGTDQSYAVFDLSGQFTNTNGFFVLGNSGVTPTPGLSFFNNTLQQGADAVALYAGTFSLNSPVTTTNLLDAVVYDNGQPDDPGLLTLLQPGQLQMNEDQNNSGTAQSLARVPDGGTPRQTSTYVAQTPTPGTFNTSYPFGLQFLQSASRVDVQEGGATDSYQIALVSIPTANVTITVDPDSQTNLGAGAGVAIVLIFTPANALIPQSVTVTAVDDLAVEGVHTSTITHSATSADSKYNGLPISNLVANIVDNDAPPPAFIAISELMYDPVDETSPGVGEWIEIVNYGTSSVDLSGWLFDDEDATNWGAIPAGTILSAHRTAVFFDANLTTAATFRSEWSVPASALVVGITWGNLANNPTPTNEILQLLNSVGVEMDLVHYDDASPWPSNLDGRSIYLKGLSLDNNSGANWARSAVGAARAVSSSGPTYSTSDVGSPGRFFLPGDYNLNGEVDAADYAVWRFTLNSTTDLRADGSGPTTGVPNGVVDQFDYTFWRANFGSIGVTGSGSGSGTGESGLAAAASASEATAAAPSASSVSAPLTSNESLAIDAAVSDFSMPPLAVEIPGKARPASQRKLPPSSSNRFDALLSLISSVEASRRRDVSYDGERATTDSPCNQVDQLFASLGAEPVSTRLRWRNEFRSHRL